MGASGILGQAFHKAMEVYNGGDDVFIPSNEKEAIEYGLKSGLAFLDSYNDGFITWTKTIPNKQKLFDLFTFCFNSYVSEMPYQNNVMFVEEKIEEDIDVVYQGREIKLPIKLKGYIDIGLKATKGIVIKDYKTCYSYSNPDKIDGAKIIQAVIYYLLVYAKTGTAPYSIIFEEVKYTKNSDGSKQVKSYEIVYEDNPLYFDLFFRIYEDIIRAVNGEMVYVPNLQAQYDNEIAIISYIHRLDIDEERAKLFKKHKVTNITDLLKKEIQTAKNMKALMASLEKTFVSAKSLDYDKMKNEEKIQTKMMEHGMILQFDSIVHGASVDLYRYNPSIGLKMARIRNYADDIQQVLGVTNVRVLAPISGTSYIGFEVPRAERTFPELPVIKKSFDIAIGQDVNGNDRRFDIRTAPHMLVAGASGSGKSVFLNNLIKQLLVLPKVELHLFDPKQVELFQFEGDKKVVEYLHNHASIAIGLENLVRIMEERYSEMKQKSARNISEMSFSYKFVVIDEYADLSLRGGVEGNIQLLAQKGRACGIHLIIATQRASTKIINGDIKVNFPVRAVFKMSKATDSRVMIDEDGAEKLLGKGDMLFLADNGLERLQGYAG